MFSCFQVFDKHLLEQFVSVHGVSEQCGLTVVKVNRTIRTQFNDSACLRLFMVLETFQSMKISVLRKGGLTHKFALL